MSDIVERWEHLPEINCYISNHGNISNCHRKVLKWSNTKQGARPTVTRRNKIYYIDELVAKSFLKSYGCDVVLHKDGNKQNNHVSNLKFQYIPKPKATQYKGPYAISYKKDNKYRIYWSETKTITESIKPPQKINSFALLTHNDNNASDDCLYEYVDMFEQWTSELWNNDIIQIDYKKAFSDYFAVVHTFNSLCKKKYESHESISTIESSYMEQSSNAGLEFLDNEYKDIPQECYSYDFKNQYALAMNSEYKIPTRQGKEVKLDKLPKLSKDLKPGFYKVKITCANKDFNKIFFFSKSNVYLDISLKTAMQYRKKYDVKIKLVQSEYNAYLYEESDMVSLSSVTSTWFEKLTTLRKVYPKNRLLKHLISSCWGSLSKQNILYRTYDQIVEEGLNVGRQDGKYDYKILEKNTDNEENEHYILLNSKAPYKHNLRLKSWVTAISRLMTASVVVCDIENVIRVKTDCITFKEELEFDDVNLVLEDKTTGVMKFHDANCYHNMTTGYKSKQYDRVVNKKNMD